MLVDEFWSCLTSITVCKLKFRTLQNLNRLLLKAIEFLFWQAYAQLFLCFTVFVLCRSKQAKIFLFNIFLSRKCYGPSNKLLWIYFPVSLTLFDSKIVQKQKSCYIEHRNECLSKTYLVIYRAQLWNVSLIHTWLFTVHRCGMLILPPRRATPSRSPTNITTACRRQGTHSPSTSSRATVARSPSSTPSPLMALRFASAKVSMPPYR